MEQRLIDDALERLKVLLEQDHFTEAADLIEELRPADQAELFENLETDFQKALLDHIETEDMADILEKMEEPQAVEVAQHLTAEQIATIADQMEPDEAADLLDDLPDQVAADVLAAMESAEEIRPLIPYPDESAGGLMTTDYLPLRLEMTAGEALQAVRDWDIDSDLINYLFVTDQEDALTGVVSLHQLFFNPPETLLADLMNRDVIAVNAFQDQEECARVISRYDLLLLPVVDHRKRLIGVITIDDVLDVLVDEASEDIQRMGASEPLDERYLAADIFTLARKRAVWLLLLFVAETFTGTVLRHFESELQAVVALSFFIPLLIGTGGNAGSQAATTVIRAMALREVRFRDLGKVVSKEVTLAILLGLFIGLVGFGRALLWGVGPSFSLVVSITLIGIILWANVVGSVIPMLAHRLRIDPTVLSAPFVTTLVDATGLFIYFTIARILLGL